MPVEEYSDDYVAQLLAKDAKASAKNYSSFGLQAFLPKRSINNAPKPNTRFLKNIIKETDNHNAALKAKEEQEARARLRELGRSGGEKFPNPLSKNTRHDETDDHRPKRRKLDDINGILNGRSMNHQKPRLDVKSERKPHRDKKKRHYSDAASSEEDSRAHRSRRHRHRDSHHHRSDNEEDLPREKAKHHKRARRRSRSRSSHSDVRDRERREDKRHRSKRHARERSTSPASSGEATSKADHTVDRRKKKASNSHPEKSRDDRDKKDDKANDSDPLESLGLIGPAPPHQSPKIKSRGRGAFASTVASTIDHHFKSNYDPTVDVIPDVAEVEDDWDQALEALKDRQQWQKNQAERLRMAGFTEVEIAKWEKGKSGAEGEAEDVKWSERGEGREWDRGKVVDGVGEVETGNLEWGRLKGT